MPKMKAVAEQPDPRDYVETSGYISAQIAYMDQQADTIRELRECLNDVRYKTQAIETQIAAVLFPVADDQEEG